MKFYNLKCFLLMMDLILANSVDPDEKQQYAAFYLGLHYLPKYPFRVQYINFLYNIIYIKIFQQMFQENYLGVKTVLLLFKA